MTKNIDQAKGRVKQAVGDLTGNEDLKKEGKADERTGDLKAAVEKAKDHIDHLIDDAQDKVAKH